MKTLTLIAMKIHKELLELSRKADKIIHSSIEFNREFLKSFKEKALEIMSCKTLEDLKNLSKTTVFEKKYKKFDIPVEESKVHLHSNKSSFASTSGFSDQNNADNSSELEKEEIPNSQQNSNSLYVSNGQKFVAENCNSKDHAQKETVERDEFAKNSKTSQQYSYSKNSKESNSQNFVKIKNFHSSTVKTSSESSTSMDIDGMYSTMNFLFEKHQNIDIMEKIEESDEEIISKKFFTVSTMIKTSYGKSSNENLEEILKNERVASNENSYSSNDYFQELHHNLPDINMMEQIKKSGEGIISQKTVTVSTMIKTSYPKSSNYKSEEIIQIESEYDESSGSVKDNFKQLQPDLLIGMSQLNSENTNDTNNIHSDKILPNENFILPISVINCNTDFDASNDPGRMETNYDEIMPENFQMDEYICENQLDMFNLNILYQIPSDIYSNASSSETQFTLMASCLPQRTVEDFKNKNINKKNKFSKIKNMLTKDFQGQSAIPVLSENKEQDKLNSKKLCDNARVKRKLKENKSALPKNTRSYNLRSKKNKPTLKTNHGNWKCCRLDFQKSLSLKEKVEENKRIREQKMKHTRERRENLEKERRERLRLREEKRIKRFEQHKKILERKIMEVKNKAKCRTLSKPTTSSSEVSPEGNIEPQSLETGLYRTYLAKDFKDISPIEPTENTQDRSSGEGLNYSLLYNSSYDKKLFMRQSVVLSDIAQLMPSETIQNCLNFSQSKETNPICNKTPNSTAPQKVSKRKLSTVGKDNSSNAPIKKLMRSTRKISVSPKNIKIDEVEKEIRNSEKGVEIGVSVMLKLPSQQTTKAKDNNAMAAELLSNPKLSMETYVVLQNLLKHKNEKPVYSEIKLSNGSTKVKAVTLSSNTINSNPKLSALSPVVVLKDISNIKSNSSRSTDDKSKATKVSVLDNGIENDPKLSILKPVVVMKDITNSKLCIQIAGKKSEQNTTKAPNTFKRKAKDCLSNNKSRKKGSENQNKRSSYSKKNQPSDTTSYEISDISDNSIHIVEKKPKKIPSWASNIYLKQAILKQHYAPQNADEIFGNFKNQKAIDLEEIFSPDKPQYHNRTSSAKWSADESPI